MKSYTIQKTPFIVPTDDGKLIEEPVCERLIFSICQKERRIIENIAYTFGFGRVSNFIQKGETYWRWTLDSKKSIERISFLFYNTFGFTCCGKLRVWKKFENGWPCQLCGG